MYIYIRQYTFLLLMMFTATVQGLSSLPPVYHTSAHETKGRGREEEDRGCQEEAGEKKRARGRGQRVTEREQEMWEGERAKVRAKRAEVHSSKAAQPPGNKSAFVP